MNNRKVIHLINIFFIIKTVKIVVLCLSKQRREGHDNNVIKKH